MSTNDLVQDAVFTRSFIREPYNFSRTTSALIDSTIDAIVSKLKGLIRQTPYSMMFGHVLSSYILLERLSQQLYSSSEKISESLSLGFSMLSSAILKSIMSVNKTPPAAIKIFVT